MKPILRQFHIHFQFRELKEETNPELICYFGSDMHYITDSVAWSSVVFSSNCSVSIFQTLNSQGRQHPDRPGFKVRAEEGFPRWPKLLRCSPDRHPLIRWEVSGQCDAGSCGAQRDRCGPVCRGPSLPQVFFCVWKIMIAANDNNIKNVFFLFAVQSLIKFYSSRWEELHALASEPMESHVFFAEHFHDAVNGLHTTLSTFSVCNATPQGGGSSPTLFRWRQLLQRMLIVRLYPLLYWHRLIVGRQWTWLMEIINCALEFLPCLPL